MGKSAINHRIGLSNGLISGLSFGIFIMIAYYLNFGEKVSVCLIDYSLSRNRFIYLGSFILFFAALRLHFGPIRKWKAIELILIFRNKGNRHKDKIFISRFLSSISVNVIPAFIYALIFVTIFLNIMFIVDEEDYTKIIIQSAIIIAVSLVLLHLYIYLIKDIYKSTPKKQFKKISTVLFYGAAIAGVIFAVSDYFLKDVGSGGGCGYVNVIAFIVAVTLPYVIDRIFFRP